ncbi:hypothetical protein SAMN02745857_04167 [Andreprevotia lacus DSM 23236]|jgi:uncharacterized protein (UPF0276 family)|uniref:Uncharacterized protein n=1 Tax=Andreprevotia lacus DSM 23236 TaxID=1121001 RepID=A0A1W1Y0Z5_9NEIS|nr:DUF692 domain-containing protein [Andreprevotia lacus]SMC29826.1 hypothetical protein SAMN02745857_04167 [Andreprevotia lacus DSM 23236]
MTHTPLAPLAGLGLRSPHIADVLAQRPVVAWWEVHSENYFGGGEPIAALEAIRADYPVSLHGVGLGLGSVDPLDEQHLQQLKQLVDRIQPALVSEHLCWNRHQQRFFNDLLPVPRLEGALPLLAARIAQVQDVLGRQLLIENVSSYVAFQHEQCTEAELLAELVARTGCGVLLDVNNLYVNTLNLGSDALAEINYLPIGCVGEIHVAGFETVDGVTIDTHGAPVCAEVWALLDAALQRFGPLPVLLERDCNLPPLAGLLAEYRELAAHITRTTQPEAVPC